MTDGQKINSKMLAHRMISSSTANNSANPRILIELNAIEIAIYVYVSSRSYYSNR